MDCMNTKNPFFLLITLVLSVSAFGQNTAVYVSDAGNFDTGPWQILKFDENGDNPEVFINDNLGWPQDIVFLEDAGTVLISNLSSGRITRHHAETGTYINDFASVPGGPTRMKIGQDGFLYVLQWNGNGRVLRFQLDGSYLGEFTSVGVSQSIGLDWDTGGNLYVSSYDGDLVRKFDSNGNDQGLFITTNLLGPTNIMFDGNGDLLVSDYNGSKIKRFDSNGGFIGDFINGVSKVEGIDRLMDGSFLVGVGGARAVRMYDNEGNYVRNFVESGEAGLIAPNAVVIRNIDPGFKINAGLNDAWYNPATDGQGFFITVFPELGVLNLAWFTYDTGLPPVDAQSNLGDPGHRWLTAIGPIDGNRAVLDVSIASGGLFDTSTIINRVDDGTITLTFESCSSGTVDYNIPSIGRTGSVPIQRVASDNAVLCEALE